VLDLDPPNSEFGLRLRDFGWNLGFWLSSVAIRFPAFSSFDDPSFGSFHPLGTLHIFPKSFLKSSSRLGDPWVGRRGCAHGLELGLLCSGQTDSPPIGRERSAEGVCRTVRVGVADRPPCGRRLSARHELLTDRPRTRYGRPHLWVLV
jgi:hypothetical protein